MTRMVTGLTWILVTAGLTGCLTPVPPAAAVIPSGSGVRAAPKASDCKLDFFRTKVDQPYDELAALHVGAPTDGYGYTTAYNPWQLQEAMRVKACALGADAVIVTQDFHPGKGGFMNGIAINYRTTLSDGAVKSRPSTE